MKNPRVQDMKEAGQAHSNPPQPHKTIRKPFENCFHKQRDRLHNAYFEKSPLFHCLKKSPETLYCQE